MNNLAVILNQQGRYNEAERIQRQTLELKERVLGHEHPSTMDSMKNLAVVLDHHGRYKEAQRMVQQTLELSQRVLGL